MHNFLAVYVAACFVHREEQGHLWASFVIGEGSAVYYEELLEHLLLAGCFDGREAVYSKVQR